jgi:hypothetical protein
LTRKYFDAAKKDHVYFSSVAKCIYDYSLIAAVERYYMEGNDEFPYEYVNVLCTVAASYLNGNVDEVDANDDCSPNMPMDVCLDDRKVRSTSRA